MQAFADALLITGLTMMATSVILFAVSAFSQLNHTDEEFTYDA